MAIVKILMVLVGILLFYSTLQAFDKADKKTITILGIVWVIYSIVLAIL